MLGSAKKRLGKDAKVTVLIKYLHPSKVIDKAMPNVEANCRLENCHVLTMDSKKVNRREQLVVVMENEKVKSNNDELAEIYAIVCWCNIIKEGPLDLLFGTEVLLPPQQEEQEQQQDVVSVVSCMRWNLLRAETAHKM